MVRTKEIGTLEENDGLIKIICFAAYSHSYDNMVTFSLTQILLFWAINDCSKAHADFPEKIIVEYYENSATGC